MDRCLRRPRRTPDQPRRPHPLPRRPRQRAAGRPRRADRDRDRDLTATRPTRPGRRGRRLGTRRRCAGDRGTAGGDAPGRRPQLDCPRPGDHARGSGDTSDGSGPNNASVVMLLESHGHRFLLSGDAEPEEEDDILAEHADLDVDVFKVAHHGSANQDPDFVLDTERGSGGDLGGSRQRLRTPGARDPRACSTGSARSPTARTRTARSRSSSEPASSPWSPSADPAASCGKGGLDTPRRARPFPQTAAGGRPDSRRR